MSSSVNPRRYNSSRRRDVAQQRRRAVLASAHNLLTSQGYASMTVPRVAASAGVSTELIYKTFGDKAGLVRALLDVTAAGDDLPIPMAQRPAVQRMAAEPDAAVVLDLYAGLAAEVNGRTAALHAALPAAAPADPRLAEVWQVAVAQRLAGARALAADVARKAPLLVSDDAAADLVWALNSPDLYLLLVRDRGWLPEAYRSWLSGALRSSLLG